MFVTENVGSCGLDIFKKGCRKLKDKLTSSNSKFGIKIKQKEISRPFIFLAILLDVDGMLLAINCQQYPRLEHLSLMERIASNIAGNIARCGCPLRSLT